MKIELEIDEARYRLRSLAPPDPDYVPASHRLTGWRVWVSPNAANSPSWFGDGPTPQAAYDTACAKLEEMLPIIEQREYNRTHAPKRVVPVLELDLSFLGEL